MIKNPLAHAGDLGLIPSSEDPTGHEATKRASHSL